MNLFGLKSKSEPILYTDPAHEPTVPEEDKLVQSVIESINGIQSRNFSQHRHGFRGTHVKTQALLKGTLTVSSGLPAHLAQGLFSRPGTYPVGLRFANEPHFLLDDRAPGPRGLGLRVFNVPGDIPEGFLSDVGERTRTQDFTFNNAPVLELRDLPTTAEIIALRLKNFDDHDALEKAIKQRDDKDLQLAPAQLPNHHFLGFTYFSQSAYRYGDWVAKYALFPIGDEQSKLSETHQIGDSSSPEQHSEWLRDWTKSHTTRFELRVQLCKNAKEQPVEDCAAEWDQDKYPFETVGTVEIPPQDSWDDARRAFWDDKVKLNVWYGLAQHRPMGSSNRLRKRLYEASQKKRASINGVELVDLKSLDDLP